MAQINAKDVMALRNSTGLPMMECKKALQETDGSCEAAEELLRKRLKGKMEKRTERAAGEGRIGIATDPEAATATIVEIRAETDFTARNEQFIAVTQEAAQQALGSQVGLVEPDDQSKAAIEAIRISTGENISFARGCKIAGEPGTTSFGSYVHHDGKTGVLIQAEGDISEDTLRQICMHVTAAVPRPLGIGPEDIPGDIVEKERQFRLEQARDSGKPPQIAEKIVEGGMRKFFEEVALLEQPFVVDTSKKVKDVIGPNARIVAFYRWGVGEEG